METCWVCKKESSLSDGGVKTWRAGLFYCSSCCKKALTFYGKFGDDFSEIEDLKDLFIRYLKTKEENRRSSFIIAILLLALAFVLIKKPE